MLYLRRGWTLAIVLIAAWTGISCSSEVLPPSDPQASIELSARFDAKVVDRGWVEELVITISAADIPVPLAFNIPVTDGTASGVISAPDGLDRLVEAAAFGLDGQQTYRGSTLIDLEEGENPAARITMYPVADSK